MSIQPIDLQTLFSHMNQVGKEQAELKDGIVQSQNTQGSEILKKAEHEDHSVSEKKQTEEEALNVKEEGKKKKKYKEGKKNKKNKKKEGKDFFKDPDLGHHVDISG